MDDRGRLARRRAQPRGGDALHPVARPGARGAAPAVVDDHAARLARARADLQGPAGAAQGARSRDLRFPRLPAAAERGHPAVPPDVHSGGRGPGRARRDHARDRAAVQFHLRPRSRISRRRPSAPSRTSARRNAKLYRELRRRYQEEGAGRCARQRPCAARRQFATDAGRPRAAARAISRAPAGRSFRSRRRC